VGLALRANSSLLLMETMVAHRRAARYPVLARNSAKIKAVFRLPCPGNTPLECFFLENKPPPLENRA
jgi:hypothetical protein